MWKCVGEYYDKEMCYRYAEISESYLCKTGVCDISSEATADYHWKYGSFGRFPFLLSFAKHPKLELLVFFNQKSFWRSSLEIPLFRKGALALGEKSIPFFRKYISEKTAFLDKELQSEYFKKHRKLSDKYSGLCNLIIAVDALLAENDKNSFNHINNLLRQYVILACNCRDYQSTCVALCDIVSKHKYSDALPVITTMYLYSLLSQQRLNNRLRGQNSYSLHRKNQNMEFYAYEYFIKRYGAQAVKFFKSENLSFPPEIKENCSIKILTEYKKHILIDSLIGEIQEDNSEKQKILEFQKDVILDETPDKLWKLHKLTGEDIIPRLLPYLKLSYDDGLSDLPALRIVKKLKDERAVKLLLNLLEKHHLEILYNARRDDQEELQLGFNKKPKKAKIKNVSMDFQLIRERGEWFGSMSKNIFKYLIEGDFAIRALRNINTRSAKNAIKKASLYNEYKAQADVALAFMDNDIKKLKQYLNSDNNAYRDESAIILTEKNIEDCSNAVFEAAARRNSYSINDCKKNVMETCKNKQKFFEDYAKSKKTREQVLAKAMLIELNDPAKIIYYNKNFVKGVEKVSCMQKITVNDIFSAGETLVKQDKKGTQPPFDKSFLPLLKYTAIFEHGVLRRGTAVAAISVFKENSSLPVLKESINMGSLDGDNPAVWALKKYGMKAKELALLIPAPKPGEKDIGLKMTYHRAGTQLTAVKSDIRGLDNILKGLDTLLDDYKISMWGYRAGIYLRTAKIYTDQRLTDMMIRILKIKNPPVIEIHREAVSLLYNSTDPRIPTLLIQELGFIQKQKKKGSFDDFHYLETSVISCLLHYLKEKTPDSLVEQLQLHHDNINTNIGILRAMAALSYISSAPYGLPSIFVEYIVKKDKAKYITTEMREKALPLLLEAVKSKNARLARQAAFILFCWAYDEDSYYKIVRNDPRAAEVLFGWNKRNKLIFFNEFKYLALNIPAKDFAPFLFSLYFKDKIEDKRYINDAVEDLISKQHPMLCDAIWSDLKKATTENPNKRAPSEIDFLHEMGKPGAKYLMKILQNKNWNQDYKIKAVFGLTKMHWQPALNLSCKLLMNIKHHQKAKRLSGYSICQERNLLFIMSKSYLKR